MFWIFAVLVGIIGAGADVILSTWAEKLSISSWLATALAYLIFMTGFGIVIKYGNSGGYRLTVAVMLVLLVNIGALALWDSYHTAKLSMLQVGGILLALLAVACFEFGRS